MKQRKILLIFLMTYVPIVLAALVAILTVFFLFVKEFQKEMNLQYYRNAAKVQNDLDITLTSITQEIHSLMWDSTVLGFSMETRPFKNEAVFNAYKILSTLRAKNSLATYNHEILLYFKNSDSVITEHGVLDSEVYYREKASKYNVDYDTWMDMISKSTQNQYIVHQAEYKGEKKTYLFFVKAISQTAASEPISSSVIILNLDSLVSEASKSTALFGGNFYVYDNHALIIPRGSHPEILNSVSMENILPEDTAIVQKQIENKVIASLPSKALYGWRYLTEVPTAIIYEKLHNIYPIAVIISFVLVLIGGFLTLIMLNKNYKPVKRIQNLLSPQFEKTAPIEDYNSIEKALLEMIDSRQKNADSIVRQQKIIRQNILGDLLFGIHRDQRKMETIMHEMDIELYSGKVLALAFFGEEKSSNILSAWESKENDFETFFNASYAVSIDSVMFVLAVFADGQGMKKIPDGLRDRLSRFCSEFPKLQCGVSGIKNNFLEFDFAYNELVVVMETASETEKNRVIIYSEIQKKIKAAFEKTASQQTANEFTYLVSELKFEEAKAFLTKMIARNQIQSTMSLFVTKSAFFTLLNGAVDKLSATFTGVGRILPDETDIFEQIANIRSMDSLKKVMFEAIDILNAAASQVNTHKEVTMKPNVILSKIEKHIIENYLDPSLNVSVIAEDFHLNLSYLSKAFKEATGKNVLEFINIHRVEHAKSLLRSTDDNIKTISEKSGFYDVNALIRCLKKYEGTTPSRYRETTN